MPYTNYISRTDAAGTIPTVTSDEFISGVAQESFLLRMSRRLRDMKVREEKLPVRCG